MSNQCLPILSIIIVTYNSKSEIRACIESLPRCLVGRDTEVIVVDNNSKDGTGDIVKSEFPWVQIIENGSNIGFSKSNNLGYELSRGEFVLFLNPDTVSNTCALEHCLKRLICDESIGVISPKLTMLNGQMDLACRRSIPTVWDGFCRGSGLSSLYPKVRIFSGYNLTYLSDELTYEVGSVNGAFMMCPRRVLLRVGVFDEQYFMYGEDLDLNYRISKARYKVVFDGRVQIVHIKGASSSADPERLMREVFNSTRQFYFNHFNPHNSILIIVKYWILFKIWEIVSGIRSSLRSRKRAQPI